MFLLGQGDVKGYLRMAVQAILDEETVDYPMGIRQSATIAFPDDRNSLNSRMTEKNRLNNRSRRRKKTPNSGFPTGFYITIRLATHKKQKMKLLQTKTPFFPQKKPLMFRQTFTFVTEIFIKKAFFWYFEPKMTRYPRNMFKNINFVKYQWSFKTSICISATPLTFDPELRTVF